MTVSAAQPFLRTFPGKCVFLLFSAVLLLLLIPVSLKCGLYEITWHEIFTAAPESAAWTIIREIRLPRTLLAVLTGTAFALSGCILQCIMRNPLASPGILGVSSGGGLAGILLMILFPAHLSLLVPAAFAGAFLTALLVYLLAWKKGIDPVRLILAGVAVSAMLGAVSSTVLLCHPDKAGRVLDFMTGSLAMKTNEHFRMVLPWILSGSFLSFFTGRKMNLLELGDDTASSLGLAVERNRCLLLLLASLLAAAGVSAAGLLGFAGLIAPHMVRMLIGPDHRFLLPGSALTGAVLVLLCDCAVRLIASPSELPAGLLLALLGPPFFLLILRKEFHHA